MSSVEVTREGRVLRVALNRPDHRNLLTHEMAIELRDALQIDDPDIGAILLEGRGSFFCYGGVAIELHVTKPLVAAVQGAALGVGLTLVAAAHVAVAAQGTSFGLLEIRNQTCPPGMQAIANAIGWRRTTELALTGRVCSTPEAHQMGLIHEIAPAFEFEARAESIAQQLAGAGVDAVRQILSQARP
jgi:enoyl-CoA hydratase/carnithine racemase